MAKWIWRFAAALALGIYFFRLTRPALHVALSPDAITNLYRVYSYPLGMLVRANLLFYETSPFYRPLASVWYIAIFHFAGTHALPYQAFNLVILAANAWLTYAVVRRLSGSCETGWLAALLACYHTQFNGLHFDAGFVFDVLCYFFYLWAFLVYLRVRQAGRYLRAGPMAACCVLYICALNSKEMAVTLPAFLGLYEWIYNPPKNWKAAELRRWLRDEGRGALVTGALGLLFAIGHVTGEFALMKNPAYRPQFTWERLMLTNRQFLGDLFFQPNWFTPAGMVALWTALAAIAWISKSKPLRFAWFFLMLSAMPMDFVDPRGAAQYYVTLFGWALYAAVLIVGLSRLLLRPLHGAAGLWAERVRAPALMAVAMLLLYPYYKALGHDKVTSVTVDGAMLQALDAQALALYPTLPPASRLLLLNETDDSAWDTWLAAMRLCYRDNFLIIDRARRMDHKLSERDLTRYDHVLDYRDGRLVEQPFAPDPRLKPVVVSTAQGLEITHSDWSPLNQQSPARRGDILIVKMKGLGATEPDVPADQPFPSEPLAMVICRVVVKVNGIYTPTLNAFGWPKLVDNYRVDLRVPESVKSGAATLEVSVRGVPAAPVQFPVR